MSEASPAYTNRHCMKINIQKKARRLGVLLQLAIAFNAAGQISISPEVGVSYFPFEYGIAHEFTSATFGFLAGMSGMIPIHERWHVNARVSYALRKDLVWEYHGIIPGALRAEYEHSDINIDFSINRRCLDWLHIGIGPSAIRKINSMYSWKNIYEDGSEDIIFKDRLDRFNYGVHAVLGIKLKGLSLKLEYYRQLRDEYQKTFVGSNRYNAVIAYPILVSNR